MEIFLEFPVDLRYRINTGKRCMFSDCTGGVTLWLLFELQMKKFTLKKMDRCFLLEPINMIDTFTHFS